MQNLDSLVERAERGGPQGGRAMQRLYELACEEDANHARMLAHPRLVPLAIELISSPAARRGSKSAQNMLHSMACSPEVQRGLYLLPGLMGVLVQRAEMTHTGGGAAGASASAIESGEVAVRTVLELLHLFENKVDFVRSEYMPRMVTWTQRLVPSYLQTEQHEMAYRVLLECVRLDENVVVLHQPAYDALLEEVFHVPGLMSVLLVEHNHVRMPFALSTLARLARCMSEEMFASPGFVEFIVRALEDVDLEDERPDDLALFNILHGLIQDPARAKSMLANYQQCIPLLVDLAAEDNDENSPEALYCLITWLLYLGNFTKEDFEHITVNKHIVLTLWRNIPGVWAVISTPRTKQRSALRRLPIEMFRLLKDTVCGTGTQALSVPDYEEDEYDSYESYDGQYDEDEEGEEDEDEE